MSRKKKRVCYIGKLYQYHFALLQQLLRVGINLLMGKTVTTVDNHHRLVIQVHIRDIENSYVNGVIHF